jgi:hypothetical protein
MSGPILLSHAPPVLVIECKACQRRGVYDRDRAIAKHGDIPLPEFKNRIVHPMCAKARDNTHFGGCRSVYSAETVAALHGR